MKSDSTKTERIIIALDTQDEKRLDFLINELKDVASFVKVGMELFYTYGPPIITKLKKNGFKVFLDLKVHDIPNTAYKSCKTITKLEADIINVHASGGTEMMKASLKGVEEALRENPKLTRPKVIAVTQLTSSDQKVLSEDLLISKNLKDVVYHYANLAYKCGLNGVVSSPLEVESIKKINPNFLCITPGIRPQSTSQQNHDQKRVTTPKEAFDLGSDYIVIGRAITQSSDPKKAFIDICEDL
jgi:orotidine-5'-phosphate decarboxylase